MLRFGVHEEGEQVWSAVVTGHVEVVAGARYIVQVEVGNQEPFRAFRRCGRPNCACAQPGHRGHGPRWLWTHSQGGRTRTRQLSQAEVAKVRAEVANYKQFAALSEQIVEVSEAICQARPVTRAATLRPAEAGPKKGTLRPPRRRSGGRDRPASRPGGPRGG